MRYEYRQVKYRAAEGRFDGSLNKMAAEGWKVESLDKLSAAGDDVFLVTYSRPRRQTLDHDVCDPADLDDVLKRNRQAGNVLVAMGILPETFEYKAALVLVWEITRPGEPQPHAHYAEPKVPGRLH